MKIVCSQAVLNQNLSLVGRAVPSRPTHPILANILLEADARSGTVTLTGFDLDLGIDTRFGAEQVEGSGRTTLPARVLSDIISRLPNESLAMEVSEDNAISLVCGSSHYQVQGASAEEFPKLPELPDGAAHVLPVSEFLEGVQRSLFAASTDESKQILNGVSVKALKEGMEFVATDAHRLSFYRTDFTLPEAGTQAIAAVLPVRSVRELEKILGAQAGDSVEVRFDEKQMIFQFPNQTLTTRLLGGRYPDYQQLLPKQFQQTADMERKRLIGCLERIAVLADQKNHIVKLDFAPREHLMTVSVDAPDVGRGRESVPVQYSGQDFSVAFNVRYLLEGLKAMDATDVSFCLNGASDPAVLKPVGNGNYQYLIMPVSIRG
ncbi:DNA polymerase III subunit beta [Gloeobacter morelensis]|uniref:Beta sliding clamp n=1 Tax=Gloeobacter morelensis MG652769 TaxID=2781736 RepID=A0ABY3PN19_9CYAN|nr:DNA polymerase III subunit beta [Gloeobacter morelensis]UFP95090.1 DNA polymerase III subunit beta [Gloeobacter morelensis MG652769]